MERSCGDRTVMMNGRPVRYIDPLSDWGFKRLFGTEVNKGFLLAFLQSIFPDKEISDISYMKPENQGLTRSDRHAVFDVACRTLRGERFIVEMQKRNQTWFRERCLYYATFLIQEQAVKGIHRYFLKEEDTGELMTDRLGFVFLEVHDSSKEAGDLVTETDKWMYVLKNLARLTDRPAGLQERVFMKLFEAAEVAAFSPEERKQYENDMMTENDYWNTIEFARDEGMRKGLDEGMQRGLNEGMKKGLDEGIEKGLVTAATNLKKMGMEINAIVQATGLSETVIRNL